MHDSGSEESRSSGGGDDGDVDEDFSLDTADGGGGSEESSEGEEWGLWEDRRVLVMHLLQACHAYDLTHAARSLYSLLQQTISDSTDDVD
eukprot:13279-Eustigmatos_ZCMA.PRE.1